MAKKNVRVEIPRNPIALLKLATGIYEKHVSDGDKSPLSGLQDNNWTDNGSKIKQAQELQAQIEAMEKDLEKLYEQRDLLVAPVSETVKSSRDLLLGIYSKNPKKLGDWDFTVNDSPKSTAKKQAE